MRVGSLFLIRIFLFSLSGNDVFIIIDELKLIKIAKTYEKRGALDAAIEEYKLLLFQDQMNPFAHWELANIYQKKNKVNEAAVSLINYYDLIFPESSEGTRTIQKLKDLNILKWNKHISRDKSDAANMDVDREKIFLFINNNIVCILL